MSLQKLFLPVVFYFLMFGCNSGQKEEKLPITLQDSIITNPPQKQIDEERRPVDENNYDISFESANQKLFVKWINSDSIQYYLHVKTSICSENYTGGARSLFPYSDSEIDEDEKGAYPVNDYYEKSSNYQISLRIALDKTKAKILFDYIGSGKKTCQPETGVILKKMTAKL